MLRRSFCFTKNGEIYTTAEMIDSQGKVTDSCPTNSRAVMRGDNRFLITDRRRVRACSDYWRDTDLECELSSPGHFRCSFIDGNSRRDDPLDYVFTR